jgi:hypothetical protein
MPNWCVNKLTIRGKKADVEACLLAIRGESTKDLTPHDAESGPKYPALDFNKIVPMPGTLNVEEGSVGDEALVAFYGAEGNKMLLKGSSIGFAGQIVADLCRRHDVGTQEELQEKMLREHPGCKQLADTYAENIRLYGHKTWYNWSCEHWGTKWNASDPVVRTRETKRGMTAILDFETAWSQPTPVMHALVGKFPKLAFLHRYWEGGSGFQGRLVGKGGEVTEDETWEYRGSLGG